MARGISQETPPDTLEPESREYLTRRFIEVGNALSDAPKFPERKEPPYKPQTGDVHYFGDPLTHSYAPEIDEAGWWGFIAPTWTQLNLDARVSALEERVDLIESVLPNLTVAGYGGIRADTITTGQSIGTGWTSLDNIFDAEVFLVPRGITQEPLNGVLIFEGGGAWRVDYALVFDCTSSGTRRRTGVRVHNLTKNTNSPSIDIPILGGADIVSAAGSFLVNIPIENVGDSYLLQIGGASAVSGVDYTTSVFEANHVGEYVDPNDSTLGPELVVNGTFEGLSTEWTFGSSWSPSLLNDRADCDGGSTGALTQDIVITPATDYRVSLQTSGFYPAGNLSLGVGLGSAAATEQIGSNGLHVFNITAGSDNLTLRIGSTTFQGWVSNVSVREIL